MSSRALTAPLMWGLTLREAGRESETLNTTLYICTAACPSSALGDVLALEDFIITF